jgi:NAD(P)H dehydrogenase (quinone)
MKRRALITGATGDTDRAAVSESIRRGLNVRAMVRTQDKRSAALEALGAEIVVGDLHQRPTYFLEWLLYFWQLPLLRDKGILRLPVGNARHAPIAAADQGRVIATILQNPEGHAGQTYPLFGPVEMNHEQMAAELTLALGRQIVFQDLPIEEYCRSIAEMGVPTYVVQHLGGAMEDYRRGVMSGMNDNVERLSGQRPMSVGDFARLHLAELNPKSAT